MPLRSNEQLCRLAQAEDTAGRQCISAPPTSLFLSLMLPQKGQPFLPERRNCSHTFRGVLQLRRSFAPQRYNTLDFPRKVVCQQAVFISVQHLQDGEHTSD